MKQNDILIAFKKIPKKRRYKLLKAMISTFRIANNETYVGIVGRLWKQEADQLIKNMLPLTPLTPLTNKRKQNKEITNLKDQLLLLKNAPTNPLDRMEI